MAIQIEAKEKISILDRYPTLRVIAARYKAVARFVQFVTLIIAAMILVPSIAGLSNGEQTAILGIAFAALVGLVGYVMAETMLAIAESILVILDIEENSRIAASQVLPSILTSKSMSTRKAIPQRQTEEPDTDLEEAIGHRSKICPNCEAEFPASTKICPDCNEKLVDIKSYFS